MTSGTILIVEPNVEILVLGEDILQRAGYRVVTATSAAEGVLCASTFAPDAVVFDVSRTDPRTACELMRAMSRRVPVILAIPGDTRGAEEAAWGEGFSLGPDFVAVVEKPFVPDRLLSAVRRAVLPDADLIALGVEFEDQLIVDLRAAGAFEDSDRTEQLGLVDALLPLEILDLALETVEMEGRRVVSLFPEHRPAVEGYVDDVSLDQILQLALSVAMPACVRLVQDGVRVEIYFSEGQVVFARHDHVCGGFATNRLVADTGSANRDASAIARRTEEIVYDLIRWKTGRFSIFSRARLPTEAEGAGVRLSVQVLLMEGLRLLDESIRPIDDVCSIDDVCPIDDIGDSGGLAWLNFDIGGGR